MKCLLPLLALLLTLCACAGEDAAETAAAPAPAARRGLLSGLARRLWGQK